MMHQAMRSNDAATLDSSWGAMWATFRMTNKRNYQEMCVLVTMMRFRLRPEFRSLWDALRTASLTGRNGSNVGWDLTVENLNGDLETYCNGKMTDDMLLPAVLKLNGIRHVDESLRTLFGNLNKEQSKGHIIEAIDRNAAVAFFKKAVGENFEEIVKKRSNKMGTKSISSVMSKYNDANRYADQTYFEARRHYVP
jgi:hypothetical protein